MLRKIDAMTRMNQFDPKYAHAVAREFAASHEGRLFHDVGSTLRRALIDSWIVRRLREAHHADSVQTMTATEIVEFRDAVATALAAGVQPAHTRLPRCAFKELE